MLKLITIVALITMLPLAIHSQVSPRDRYLDPSFKKEVNDIPESRKSDAQKAFRLMEEGIRLYKLKKDRDAIDTYEQALEIFAAPEIYYHYGNSLSNIDELIYSVKAYEYAIEHNYTSPELAWYNMACSLSRLGRVDKTYSALKNAILAGYSSIDYMKSDSDLAYIRTDSKWNEKFMELKSLFDRGKTQLPSGKKYRHGMASTIDIYSFCPDGKAMVEYSVSKIKNRKKFGTWKFRNFKVMISWNRESGGKGIGQPELGCGAVCSYKNYEPFERKILEKEIINWQEVEEQDGNQWQVLPLTGTCE